jgi:demethylmenaquinone methyltransferase/2-methoxy-6-polyprenyl-1,4-benzoquinol methylase
MPEGSSINAMFGQIAKRYDLANHLLSGGMDQWWARCLVKKVKRAMPTNGTVADLATGSGDIAFALSRAIPEATVRGFDFCQPMLDEAVRKMNAGAGNSRQISFAIGDCMALPLDDNSVDAVTIAYGVRNFENRAHGLGEIRRVLRPGGSAFILEFTQPWWWFRPFYYFYLKLILPWFARLATGNKDAYDYLAGSIAKFPNKKTLSEELKAVGFSTVKASGMTASIVAIHHAVK